MLRPVRRGSPAPGGAGCRHPGAGGLRPAGVGHRRHHDPAPRPGQPRRPDADRRLHAAGRRPRGGCRRHQRRGSQPRPAAVELLRPRRSVPTAGSGWPSTIATPNRICPTTTTSGSVPTTVGSIDGSHVQWRAVSVRGPHGELTTVAIDLSDVQSTVRVADLRPGGHRRGGAAGARHRRLCRRASQPAAAGRSREDRGGHRRR